MRNSSQKYHKKHTDSSQIITRLLEIIKKRIGLKFLLFTWNKIVIAPVMSFIGVLGAGYDPYHLQWK